MTINDDHYLKRELYCQIQSSPQIFEFLISGSLDGIWYWNIEHPEDEWMSPKFWEVLGYDPNNKKHLASEWQHIINQEDLQLALKNFEDHCADQSIPYDQVVRYKHRNGSTVWVRCRGVAIRDKQGKAIRMLGAHNDVTDLKRAEFRSYHDELTSLYNRYFLFEELSNTLRLSARQKSPLSIAMIDLDNFKNINDEYGHVFGDDILKKLSSIIVDVGRGGDVCCRYGGEEFLVLLPNTDINGSILYAERLRASVSSTFIGSGNVTVSIGISTFHKDTLANESVDALGEQLIKQADDAMYLAKEKGKNQVIHHGFFDKR